MIGDIMHVGLTVSDIDRSIAFYRDVLGLNYIGRLTMEGKETEKLFNRPGAKAYVAYLKRGDIKDAPPVELIQFFSHDCEKDKCDLFKTSISELCLATDDIWADYERMKKLGVEFISEPQEFDFKSDGFGKSMALYFKDPDGIILELMQAL